MLAELNEILVQLRHFCDTFRGVSPRKFCRIVIRSSKILRSQFLRENGTLLNGHGLAQITGRWTEYIEDRFEVENQQENIEPAEPTHGPIEQITEAELEKHLGRGTS